MTLDSARLLFDECFGKPAVDCIAQLSAMGKGEKPEIRHLFEFAPSGTRDEDWIPKLADENWLVLTTDGGRKPNKKRGEKLPRICARLGVTHVILSPVVHSRNAFEKMLTVLSVWYPLLAIATDEDERGSRFMLEPTTTANRGQGRLSKREIPDHLKGN